MQSPPFFGGGWHVASLCWDIQYITYTLGLGGQEASPSFGYNRSVMWTRQSQVLSGSLWYACMTSHISRESHGTAELPLRWRRGVGGKHVHICLSEHTHVWATRFDHFLVFKVIRKLLSCHKMVKSECHQIKLWKQCLCWHWCLPSGFIKMKMRQSINLSVAGIHLHSISNSQSQLHTATQPAPDDLDLDLK